MKIRIGLPALIASLALALLSAASAKAAPYLNISTSGGTVTDVVLVNPDDTEDFVDVTSDWDSSPEDAILNGEYSGNIAPHTSYSIYWNLLPSPAGGDYPTTMRSASLLIWYPITTTPPTVTIDPASATINVGESVNFTARNGLNGYVWGGKANGTGDSQYVTFSSPGTYTVTVYSPAGGQYSASNVATATVTVAPNSPPIGSFDGANPSSLYQNQTISAGGWAADPEMGAPVSSVAISVDGSFVGYASLGGQRQDVVNAYGRQDYLNSGWNFSWNIGNLAAGAHTMSATATDNMGASASIGSKTFFSNGPILYTLTLNFTGSGSGSVTVSPPGGTYGGSTTISYPAGTVVSLSASPNSGSKWGGFNGAGQGSSTTSSVTMNSNVTVTADFDPGQVSQPPLSLNASSPQSYGTTQMLTTSGGGGTGAIHYQITSQSSGGVATLNGSSLTANSGSGWVTLLATKDADTNYFSASSSPVTVNFQKATATVSLGNLSQTYDGSPKSATATTSPGGLSVSLTYNGSASAPSAIGNYTVVGTINDPNYQGSASGTLTISGKPVTFTFGNLSQQYDGSVKTATVTPSDPAATYTSSLTGGPSVGSYGVSATANGNYSGSGSATLNITAKPVTFVVTDPTPTFDGNGKSAAIAPSDPAATYTVKYNGSTILPNNAGTYTVSVTATGNYSGSGTGTLTIQPKPVTISIPSLNVTYDGATHSPAVLPSDPSATYSVSYSGSGGTTYGPTASAPKGAGNYLVSATATGNYTGSGSGSLTINRKAVTFAFSNLSFTYDGTNKTATVTPSDPATTYTSHLTVGPNVGSYIVAADATGNFTGTGSASLVISPESVTFTVVDSGPIYDGTGKSATITSSDPAATYTVQYNGGSTLPINAGGYAVSVTATGNYTGTGSGTLTIKAKPVTFTFGALTQSYDGSTKTATATPSDPAATFDASLTGGPAIGSYPVSATANGNYTGSGSATLVITSKAVTFQVVDPAPAYDGTGKSATITPSDPAATYAVNYNGSPALPVGVGSYAVTVTATGNYSGTGSGTLTITPKAVTFAFGGLSPTYNGAPHSPTVTPSDPSASFGLSYAGTAGTSYGPSVQAPSNAGSYTVTATATGNYSGTSSSTMVINPKPVTFTFGNLAQTYDGTVKTATVTPSDPAASYDSSLTGGPAAGSYPVSATAKGNFTGTGSATLVIAAKSVTFQVTDPSPVFDGTGKSATVTPSDPLATYSVTYNGSGTLPSNAGSYTVAVTGTGNYTGTGSGTLTIKPKAVSFTISGITATYDGTPHAVNVSANDPAATYTVSYVGTGSTAYGPSNTPPTNAGNYTINVTATGNYSGTGVGTLTINRKFVTFTFSNLTQTYDGSIKTVTVTASDPAATYTGNLTGGPAVGAYPISVTATGNYIGNNSGTLFISAASVTFQVADPAPTYDGSGKAATVTPSDPAATYVVKYNVSTTLPVNAGSYTVGVTATGNYVGTGSGSLTIKPKPVLFTFTGLSATYDGAPHSPTVSPADPAATYTASYAGASGTIYGPTPTPPTNAGTYTITATGTGNYTGSNSATFGIGQKPITFTFGNLNQTYDGTVKTATVTPSDPAATYTSTLTGGPAAGTYPVSASATGNYSGSGSASLVIGAKSVTFDITDPAPTFDGSGKSATITASDPAATFTVKYNGSPVLPVNAGSYTVDVTATGNYSGSGSGTLTIKPKSVTFTLSGLSSTYDGTAHGAAVTASDPAATYSVSYSGASGTTYGPSATPPTNAGNYTVTVTGTGNYSGSATGALAIAQKSVTFTFGNLAQTYDGTVKTATVTPSDPAATYTSSLSGGPAAGTYPVSATATGNYTGSGSASLVISSKTVTFQVTDPGPTFDGTAKSANVTASDPSATFTVKYDGSTALPVNVGTYTVDVAATGNYSGSGSGTLTIKPKLVTFTLGGLTSTYDGAAHGASVTVSDPAATYTVSYSGTSGTSYGPSATPPTNSGSYTVTVTATGNYSGSASGALAIAQKPVTFTFGNLAQTYDGTVKTATVTPSDPAATYNSSLTGGPAAGTYPVSATATGNYNGSGSASLVIGAKTVMFDITDPAPTFDGTGKSATVTASDPAATFTVKYNGSGVLPVNAGTYTVDVTATGNYSGSGSGTLTIKPKSVTFTLSGLTSTYDGTAHGAAVAASDPAATYSVSYSGASGTTYGPSATPPTNAGNYTVTVTGTGNYAGTASGTLAIAQKSVTFTFGNLAQTYDGTVKTATVTLSDPAATYTSALTGGPAVGTYPVSATATGNYAGSGSASLVISPKPVTFQVTDPTPTFDGTAKSATISSSDPAATYLVKYNGSATLPVNAGSYTVDVTATGNYTGTGSGTLTINRKPVTFTFGNLSQTFDGTPKTATVTPSDPAATYDSVLTAGPNVGTYPVSATATGNYSGSGSASLVIGAKPVTFQVADPAPVYDGTGKSATVTASDPAATYVVKYNGSTTLPSNAGTYTVDVTATGNYSGSGAGTLTIEPKPVTFTLSGLTTTYDGTPHPAGVAASDPAATFTLSYSGNPGTNYGPSAAAPTNAGSYNVSVTATGNYAGTASGTLAIARKPVTFTFGNLSQTYDGTTKSAAVTPSDAAATYDSSLSGGPGVGTYPVSATATGNYTGTGSASLVINAKPVTFQVVDPAPTYDGTAKAATVTPSDPAATFVVTYNGSATLPVNAGSYVVAVTASGNFSGSGSGTLTIQRKPVTFTFGNLSQTYDSTTKSATVTPSDPAATYDSTLTGGPNVGTYSVSATATGNYTGTGTASLVINAKPVTFQIVDPAPTYDGTAKSAVVTSSDPAATFVVKYNGSATLPINAGTYTVDVTATGNYSGTGSGTLTIGKATPAITWTAPAAVTYGTALTATQLDATANVPGTFTYTPNAGSVLAAGTQTLTVAFTPTDAVDYAAASAATTITVNRAPLTATADDKSKVYGTQNAPLTISFSGFVNGDTPSSITSPAISTAATTSSPIGTYPITLSGGSAANYTLTLVDGTLTVTAAAVTFEFSPTQFVYNAAPQAPAVTPSDPAATFTLSYVSQPDTPDWAQYGPSSAPPTNAAAYTVTATATGNYSGTTSATFVIARKPVIWTWAPRAFDYDGMPHVPTLTPNDPQTTFELLEVTGVTDAGTPQQEVTGTVIPSIDPETEAGNYFNAVNATGNFINDPAPLGGAATQLLPWRIKPAPLTVTADDQARVYGVANPPLTISYSGFVNGETPAVFTTLPTATTSADATSNPGSYPIVASGGVAANYSLTYVNGTLTIGQATPVLSWSAPAPIVYGTALDSTQLNATASVPGSFAYTPAAGTVLPVGNHTLTAVFTPSDTTDYTSATIATTLEVDPATLTVTADNQTRIYDTPNPVLTFQYSGFVNGDTPSALTTAPTASTTATITSSVGNYPITVGGGAAANYVFKYVAGNLSITPATPIVSWAAPAAIPYGTALDATQLNATANVPGSFAYTPAAGTVLGAGTHGLGVVFTPTDTLDYTNASASTNITVNPVTLTVRADDQTKVYGTANPALTISYSGFVNGDTPASLTTQPTASTVATAASHTGSYTITAAGGVSPNYVFQYVPGTLTITPASLTVTANDKSKVYGSPNPSFDATITGFVNGDTLAVVSGSPAFTTSATASSPAGDYAIKPSLGSLTAADYVFAPFVDGTLTIGRAVLTVTADDKSKVYGDALPALTVTYSGFVNGDTPSSLAVQPTPSTNATAASGIGTYPITVAGGVSPNYAFTYVAGTLTITRAPLTVTANDKAKIYGSANPPFDATITGFVNGDTAAVVSGSAVLSTTATTSSGAGTYAITPSLGSLAAANYAFTSFVNGTLTVTQAPLVVTANNQSRLYGAANPVLTLSYSGFVNGDTPASLTTVPTATTPATVTSPVGNYPIVPSGGASPNYTFTYVNGTLHVTPAPLTVTANDKTKVYGQANPTFDATITGFVNGETVAVVSGAPTFSTTATSATGAGSYPITPGVGTLSATNYAFTQFVNGTLTITQAPLTVTADNQTRMYGTPNPTLTVTYTGFVNGDSATSLATPPTVTTTATTASPVGTYPIVASGAASPNYTFTYVNGTLTVTAAPLVVTITGPAPGTTAAVNVAMPFTATFTSTGVTGTYTGTWVFTPASGNVVTVPASISGNSITNSVPFAAAGVYDVSLIVTHSSGTQASANTVNGQPAYVVVYDPNAKAINGGGWLDVPPGTTASLTTTAKSNFTINVQYNNGVPQGKVSVDVKAVGFQFDATSIDWIVSDFPYGEAQGKGTVNGAGNYAFYLKARDGNTGSGRLRLIVWDPQSGAIIFDNQVGDPRDAALDLQSTIQGGNLSVH
jgi:hypothetical protein